MASPWCRPISVPGLLNFAYLLLLLSSCALESTTQWRLSAIKVKLELEFSYVDFYWLKYELHKLYKYFAKIKVQQ